MPLPLFALVAPESARKVLSTQDCARFLAQVLSSDVAYVPGLDGHSNRAPAADLEGGVQVRIAEEIEFDIELDLAGYSSANAEIGTVHHYADKIMFNSLPLQNAKLAL